jgi:hypothetical protein
MSTARADLDLVQGVSWDRWTNLSRGPVYL